MGVATQSQVRVLSEQICALTDAVEINKDEIIATNTRLTSLSDATNRRLTNMQEAILNLNDRLVETRTEWMSLSHNLSHAMTNLNDKLHAEIRGTMMLVKLLRIIENFQEHIDTLDADVDRFVNGVDALITGYLPGALVPHHLLENVITKISRQLSLHSIGTSLVETQPNFYYMLKNVVVTKSETMGRIFAMVGFPIRAEAGGLMSLYRVETFPITLNSSSQITTRVENVPDFLAFSVDGRYFSEYSGTEIATCTGEELLTCSSERSLRSRADPSCLTAIFDNNGQEVNKHCDYSLETEPLPSFAIKIDTDLYLLHSARVNESSHPPPNWQIECVKNGKITTKTIEACSGCLHRLQCGCSLNAPGEFIIPDRLCDSSDTTVIHDDRLERRYLFNLPFTYSLYGDNQQINYRGDDMFTVEPKPTIPFPVFKPFQADFTAAVERDTKFKIDLRKYTDAIKKNTKAYANKASAAITEARKIADGVAKNINVTASDTNRLSWLLKLAPSTVTGAVAVGYVLPIISCILLIFVLCKM